MQGTRHRDDAMAGIEWGIGDAWVGLEQVGMIPSGLVKIPDDSRLSMS